MMIEIGRICIKIAGRDAGLRCVVVDDLGKGIVLIDGQTRRRKCNIKHLEPLAQKLGIKKNASHDEIAKEFKKMGLKVMERKPKKKTDRPKRTRKTKEKAPKASAEAGKQDKQKKAEPKKPQPKKEKPKTEKSRKK